MSEEGGRPGESPAGADDRAAEPGSRLAGRRSQLVLVAAGVAAMGLLPIVLAYTQLGYGAAATAEPAATGPSDDALRALERAAFDAAEPVQGRTNWSRRSAVADAVVAQFDARAASIETAGVEREIVHEVERNQSAAAAWASANCPWESNREFGSCEAEEGVVLQERAGETHVVLVAVDLRTVTEEVTYSGTYVLDAETGTRRSS